MGKAWLVLLTGLAAATFACSDDPANSNPPPDGGGGGAVVCGEGERRDDVANTCKPIGWSACPTGFSAAAEGHGCIEVIPAGTCEAGTMPAVGEATCKKTGIEACATGFGRDASKWGCAATLPAVACAGATKETIGSVSCQPIGDCAAAFPPAGASVFVDPSFTDGELDATHVRTIEAGIAAASANATIAVAAATYATNVVLTKSVRIVGRCAAQVSITGSTGISASGAVDVTLERVTIAGGSAAVDGGAKLTLRDAVVDARTGTGVVAKGSGTRLIVERSVVRGGSGPGIDVGSGADLELRDAAVTDNVEVGVRVAGSGSQATIERSAILRTKTTGTNDFGVGAIIRDGASAAITGSVLAQNHEVGVVAFGKGTKATLTDVSIDDTQVSGEGHGRGLYVDGAVATLERVSITRSRDSGIVLAKAGEVIARSTVVADTQEGADGNGLGVVLLEGTKASFTGSAFAGNHDAGLSAVGTGTSLALEGSIVTGTRPDVRGDRGYGIAVESGASVDLQACALVDNTGAGLAAIDPGTRVTIARTAILDTKPVKDERLGRGVSVETGASATITQSVLLRNHDIGVSARGAGATATIDESVIRATRPQVSSGTHGRGAEAGSGAKITLSRASILENHSVGVLAISDGSSVDVTDTWIADTAADGSAGGPGRAATAQGGASLSLTGVWAERNAQIAVLAAAGASLAVRSSVVETTTKSEDAFGHGIFAFEGSLATMSDVTVRGNAAVGLFFASSRGTVQNTRVVENAIGIHVQDGATLSEAATVPEDPPEDAVVVSSDTVFDGNGSRVGTGALPLPTLEE